MKASHATARERVVTGHPAGASTSAQQHSAAVLIGFNHYPPATGLKPLQGAVNDCRAMAEMLVRHEFVKRDAIYTYVSDTPGSSSVLAGTRSFVDPNHVPPSGVVLAEQLLIELRNLIAALANTGHERLYVYVSGHGGDFPRTAPPLSALFCSEFTAGRDASNFGLVVIDALHHAAHYHGTFKEVIVIADCCRSRLSVTLERPALGPAPSWNPNLRCLTIKATTYNNTTTEAPVPTSQGHVVYGAFTRTLINAIDHHMTRSGDVTWREVCDDIAQSGRSIESVQTTSYPLMLLKGQPARTPVSVPPTRDAGHDLRLLRSPSSPLRKYVEYVRHARPLINGISMLDDELAYLTDDERGLLVIAQTVLRMQGRPAGERDSDERELGRVVNFLEHQTNDADPLAFRTAPAEDRGFKLHVSEVIDHADSATIHLTVTRPKDTHARGVRFYLHPTMGPPIIDVPFTDDDATVILDVWGAFTVLSQVQNGPMLQLNLENVAGLPQHIREA